MESNGPSSIKNRSAYPNDQNGGLFFSIMLPYIGAQMPNVYDIHQTPWTAWKSTLSKQRTPSGYFRVNRLTDLMLQNSASSNLIGSNIFYLRAYNEPYYIRHNLESIKNRNLRLRVKKNGKKCRHLQNSYLQTAGYETMGTQKFCRKI